MTGFFRDLVDPAFPFLRYAVATGVIASIAFGVMGSYVVSRRISYLAAAISHSVLGGIGLALYLREVAGMEWLEPMYGAVAAALLSALVIGVVSLRGGDREDTVIGAIWALGMGIGLIFFTKTPGYIDPMSYLFGDILLISKTELLIIAVMDIMVVFPALYFRKELTAVCFDSEFAWVRGLNAERYYLMLLLLTSLTVVLLVEVIGIVLVIALLTIPPAVASAFTGRLGRMMIIAVIACMIFTTGGLFFSYRFDLPGGPSIIVFAVVAYLVLLPVSRLFSRSR
jgi:zinc transport system permease protein